MQGKGLTEDGRPVIQWSKKTGDYSVLSHPDLCVLALTHTLHEEAKNSKEQGAIKEVESREAGVVHSKMDPSPINHFGS